MPKGCLAALFGIYSKSQKAPLLESTDVKMNEGDIHSGPGGYEGMGYQGGYAHDYLTNAHEADTDSHDESEH